MHICFVEGGYPHYHGGGGGAGTYVQLLAKELIQRGCEVSVIASVCGRCPKESYDDGVRIYRYASIGKLHWYLSKLPFMRPYANAVRYLEGGWSIFRFLEALHQRSPIDLVEFTEGGDFWHAFFRRFPYIVHFHGSAYTFEQQSHHKVIQNRKYDRSLELIFIRKASAIFSPSKALVKIVSDEARSHLPDNHVIPYPIDPRLLLQNKPGELDNRNCKKVMFAARNDPVKGGEVLLNAVPLVLKNYPDVQFDFYGYQPEANIKIPDNVFFNPFVSKTQLIERYQEADICVVPSLWDNSPNTVYEAMAAGKAVVASDVGGIPELVVDGKTGFLVEPGDPYQLADSIVALLKNPQLCNDMGSQGKERITKLANLTDNVDNRLKIYQSIISK